LGRTRGADRRPLLVGFKAETTHHLERARAMLAQKHLDMVVANRVEAEKGFRAEASEAWIVTADGRTTALQASKADVAHRIWDEIGALLGR
jgi:phosphopantothenoylcysteine decarboxylase/phosphopantothenate--cysteine ligase